jgi:hypothetical protein
MQTNIVTASAPVNAGHHTGGSVVPGQPPAHVLPTPIGPGTTQPPDVPDTAKGSPLPHWDGVLVGVVVRYVPEDPRPHTPLPAHVGVTNIYVNGAFNYGDFESVEQALAATQQLTAGPERPAAVIWKDRFGIVHAQALLQGAGGALEPEPTALHLTDESLFGARGAKVVLGHPEALYVVDGDVVVGTSVPKTVPVPANGGTGWSPGGAS